MAFDPIPSLMATSCPAQVVLAGDDANVAPIASLERFREVQRTRGGEFRIEVLAGLSHLFTTPGTTPDESRPTPAESLAPGYLDLMAEWMARVTAP